MDLSNRWLVSATRPSRFDWRLALGEGFASIWLISAAATFYGGAAIGRGGSWIALAAVASSWALGLHSGAPVRSWAALLVRSVGQGILLALLIEIVAAGPEKHPAWGFAAWLGAAVAILLFALRVCHRAASVTWPRQKNEILRWIAVGVAGFLVTVPYFGRNGLGSGDAYWYVVMLADVVTQARHGVFPVWIGQSEYAFNGPVSPLRLAPWFQYSGMLVDALTARRLEPTAIKNVVLGLNGLGTAASGYLAVRCALPRRPTLACALALLWLVSPAVLAPLYAGDQYMAWMAMPFIPPLLLGCLWLWTRDDPWSRALIAVSLAGMMLAHTPTALWGGILAAAMYLGQLLVRRAWFAEARRIAAMAAVFAVLGAFPIGSALTIDNAVGMNNTGSQVTGELTQVFPGNLRPIDAARLSLKSYQPGYTLLGVGLVGLVLLIRYRPRGWIAFAVAELAVVPLTFPVPGVTPWIWSHTPQTIVTITTLWPTQRIFVFWDLIFIFALILGTQAVPAGHRRARRAILLLGLLVGSAWSIREAVSIVRATRATYVSPAAAAISLRPDNVSLTRYVYASFAAVPGYASHAHQDPLFENRLLDRETLRVVAANADGAAPAIGAIHPSKPVWRLVQSGTWHGASDNHSRFYELRPTLHLASGQNYALRLEFLRPGQSGVLQIMSDDLFREYLLPDSGVGLAPTPLGFGSFPSSSHVMELEQHSGDSVTPDARIILPQYQGEGFDFARFWLYTFNADDLPVKVSSWIPYRARLETAVPVFLETPRLWQRGWRARVNGAPRPTRESPQHLVMVPIEPGFSRIELTFHPPLWLSIWFWVCAAGWIALLAAVIRQTARRAVRMAPG